MGRLGRLLYRFFRRLLYQVNVDFELPFGIGKISFTADRTQQKVAWNLYVEMMTRITIQPLENGLLTNALDSLYSHFQLTRNLLEGAGPSVGYGGFNKDSLGSIAMRVLNDGLRPFLSKWHPLVEDYHKKRPENIGKYEYEQQWDQNIVMRKELDQLQRDLEKYAEMLAKIAGVKHTKVKRPE
jgi:hypothetical protein